MPLLETEDVDALFGQDSLKALINIHSARTDEMVDGIDSNEFLITPVEDLVQTVVRLNGLAVPRLLKDEARMEQPAEIWRSTGNPFAPRIKGMRYQLTVPFEGDQRLFWFSPEGVDAAPPRAKIFNKQVFIRLDGYDLQQADVKREIENLLQAVEIFLDAQGALVDQFMSELEMTARAAVESRKRRILESQSIAASLGFPMVRRGNDPMVYISSAVRRNAPVRPSAIKKEQARGNERFNPEPTLAEQEYQHILKVIEDMTLVMERSPSAFMRLEEEHLRDFYLVTLNSHYEGGATGETFNSEGKTGILIKDRSRNIFIAECKIWSGEKKFSEAINQLLGYLTWRDTKAALIIFNRNKDFTSVLETMRTALENHPHKKRGPTAEGTTRFRCIFGNPNDRNREIIVTTLAFDVPR